MRYGNFDSFTACNRRICRFRLVFNHACAVRSRVPTIERNAKPNREKWQNPISNSKSVLSAVNISHPFTVAISISHMQCTNCRIYQPAPEQRILWSGAQVLCESHIWSVLWRWRYAELVVLENRFGLLKVFRCGSSGYSHSALEETNRLIASFVCVCVCAWPIAFHLELPFLAATPPGGTLRHREMQTAISAAMHFLWSGALSQSQKSWKCI